MYSQKRFLENTHNCGRTKKVLTIQKSEYFYYNEEGQQIEHHDRNGNTIHRMYTIDGNLAYERAIDPSSKYAVINQYVYYPDGTIKRATGGGITYEYTYTKTGQLKTKSSNGKSLLDYTYDQNGNRKTLIDPSGKQVTYTYDSMDRMTKVEDDRGQTLAEYQYTKSGKLQSTVLGNGIKTEYNYFEDEQLESLITVTNNGNVLLNFDYAYDGNGNCIKKAGKLYQHFYGYDKKNQLITAEYNGVKEYYTYDLVGNRKTKEVDGRKEEYFYNKKNQLTQLKELDKVTDYTYDRQGNLLLEKVEKINADQKHSIEEKVYQYDSLNRQQKVVTPNFIQENVYDAEGLRYQTIENEERFQFIFDRRELLFESKLEKEESDQVESIQDFIRYFRGNDVLALEEEGETSYYIQDEMRSTMFLVDSDYTIKKSYEYDAFGSIIKEQGQSRNRLTYTEQFYDTGLGQYYLRARYYNPRIARFIQEDPYRGDGLNLYAYCHNHPVGYYDPSGYLMVCIHKGGNGNLNGLEKNFNDTEVAKLLDNMPELSGTNREKLLSVIQNEELHKIVNELYRPTAMVGDGGTAAKLMQEFYEGSSKHLQKSIERLKHLNNLIGEKNLGLNDLDIAETLRDDLKAAINLFQ